MKVLVSVLLLLSSSGLALAAEEVPIGLDRLYSSKVVSGYQISDPTAIQKFYSEEGGKFLWVDGNQLSATAKEIVEKIGIAWHHGLNPENYHFTAIREIAKNGVPQGREIETEILLSDAVIRYGRDVSGMRLPATIAEQDTGSWSRGINGYSLLNVLSEQTDPAAFLDQLLPQDREYKRLTKALVELADDLARNPEKSSRPLKFPGTIKLGMHHAVIPEIRKRLGVAGHSDLYDQNLKAEIEAFQKKNGLVADGIIGLRSFDAINQTRTQKLVKLIANLERRRWVKRPLPSRYIAVNIPQMQLQAIENDQPVFEMPVIVGRQERPTMSFVDQIVGIRFNPKWYVPDTIKNEDFLPALQKDPLALEKKGIQFRIKSEEGMKKVLPTEIDWKTVTPEKLKSIQMYQDAGGENALGLIRVLMPNRYDIYLHDTNAPELFAKNDRALSSGCIRMAEPRRIANFILGTNEGWSDQKIDSYFEKHKLIEVTAQQPMPVYLFYYTAWVDDQVGVVITNDLYGVDRKLVQLLQSKGKIPFELGKIQ